MATQPKRNSSLTYPKKGWPTASVAVFLKRYKDMSTSQKNVEDSLALAHKKAAVFFKQPIEVAEHQTFLFGLYQLARVIFNENDTLSTIQQSEGAEYLEIEDRLANKKQALNAVSQTWLTVQGFNSRAFNQTYFPSFKTAVL